MMQLLLVLLIDDTDAIRARIAIELALRTRTQVEVAPKRLLNYAQGMAKAVAEDRPLIVFVGVSEQSPARYREISGAVSCVAPSLFDDPRPRIVVASPKYWIADLPANATDAQIQAAIQRRTATSVDAGSRQDVFSGQLSSAFFSRRSC